MYTIKIEIKKEEDVIRFFEEGFELFDRCNVTAKPDKETQKIWAELIEELTDEEINEYYEKEKD